MSDVVPAGVTWERTGHVGWIRLDRPEQSNAIDPAMRAGLDAAIAAHEADDEVRVVVLTGNGRHFCAGVDLKSATPVDATGPLDLGAPVAAPISRLTRPVIAAVNGAAVGGGFELALACDLRVASSRAFFSLTELRIGSLPGSGGTQRLFDALPSAIAWRMLLTGERLDAEAAGRHGLVSDVFDEDGFEASVAALADRIAEAAPLSLRAAKLAAGAALGGEATGHTLERVLWRLLAATDDRQEGRAAFREKRPPHFTGR